MADCLFPVPTDGGYRVCKNKAVTTKNYGILETPDPPICQVHLTQMAQSHGFVTRKHHDKELAAARAANQRIRRVWKTYLIASSSYVKIGRAYDPEARLRQLNGRGLSGRGVVCPPDLDPQERLVLLGTLEEDWESVLHLKFKELRVVGEWFRRTPATEAALDPANLQYDHEEVEAS